ncbi:Surfeit locus protein 1, partial [Acropora cervicornis]
MFSRCNKIFSHSLSRGIRVLHSIKSSPMSTTTSNIRESKMYHLLLIIPISTFGLGTWQIFRLHVGDLSSKDSEYRRVRLRGKFDHSEEIHVLPRSLNEGERSGGGLGRRPKSGAHIITPFEIADSRQRILVNRGWVPKDKIEPKKRLQGQIEGEIELVGFIRQGEKRQPFQAQNNPEKNQWISRDVDAMAEVTGSLPILVDADSASTVPGGPIGGQTRVYLRNEHL